jgi:hypothetical protein
MEKAELLTEITAGIVSHLDRRDRANRLHTELNMHFPTALFTDDGTLGCDHNHLTAWECAATGAPSDWCAVFEDDAEPVPNLGYHLDNALHHAPAPVVSLYLGRARPIHWQKRIENAVAADRPFIVANRLLHCVAVAIRTGLVLELIKDAREAIDSEVDKPIDEALSEALLWRNLPIAYTNPSLVDHADTPTLARHRYPERPDDKRVAWRVGVPDSWAGQFSIM